MKKISKLLSVLFIILFVFATAIGLFLSNKVEKFEHRSIAMVLKSDKLIKHFAIGKAKDPSYYGYKFKKVYYKSTDGVKLNGWFIKSKKQSNKCIVFLHGQVSNKLKPMKYLEIIKKYNLDKNYSVFLPDLRNCGESEDGKTALGIYFAEDIYSTLKFIKNKFHKNNNIIYAFSQGAMGTLLMLDNKKQMADLKKENIKISKIIFDSPLSNARETIINEAVNNRGYPKFIVDIGLLTFNLKHNFKLNEMSLAKTYRGKKIPLLIIQSEEDPTVPYFILMNELKNLTNKNISLVVFKKGLHVKIYRTKGNTKRYCKKIINFIRGK